MNANNIIEEFRSSSARLGDLASRINDIVTHIVGYGPTPPSQATASGKDTVQQDNHLTRLISVGQANADTMDRINNDIAWLEACFLAQSPDQSIGRAAIRPNTNHGANY